VTKRDIKRERKGRPVHSYRLSIPLDEILAAIEAQEKERIKRMESALNRLRTLAKR